jgi:hypothetical protein
MLEVTVVIGGALIAFIAMMLWANSGRFKSENAHEDRLTAVALLVSVDVGFTVDVLVLVPSNRRMAVLRRMFVGAIVSRAKAMAGFAVMAAVGKAIVIAPMGRIVGRVFRVVVESAVAGISRRR